MGSIGSKGDSANNAGFPFYLWQTLAGRCNSHLLDFILILISDDDGGHFQALGRKLFKVFGTLLVVKVEEQESIVISPILK